jgi:hypothetical protein
MTLPKKQHPADISDSILRVLDATRNYCHSQRLGDAVKLEREWKLFESNFTRSDIQHHLLRASEVAVMENTNTLLPDGSNK